MHSKPNYFLISFFLSLSILLNACAATGILGGSTSYVDRRTTESQITDEKLEWQTVLKTQDIEGEFRANFVSYNQIVLITGQAPNQEIIDKVFNIVTNMENVRKVENYMVVGPENTIRGIANDIAITSNVISRAFVDENKDQASVSIFHWKVFTEEAVVYLMGILNQEEADKAVAIAKSSRGVKKVVPLFEIDNTYKSNPKTKIKDDEKIN
jgi:osmotically-inducible protein OsmY